MVAVTSQEMRDIDARAINDYKIPGIVLMENAASAAVKVIKEEVLKNQKILILCGIGNNGGDGFAIARMLIHAHYQVTIGIVGEVSSIKGDAKINYEIMKSLEIHHIQIHSEESYVAFRNLLNQSDIIIDAMLGTGCSRELEGDMKQVVLEINQGTQTVFAIDVPTGINADNGRIMGTCIKASKTITFCLPKVGLLLLPGVAYTGETVVVDIGIPERIYQDKPYKFHLLDDALNDLLPKRKMVSHKGTYGKILVVAGSKQMMGALLLSSLAAYKTGAGLVSVLTEAGNEQALFSYVPEAIIHTYTKDETTFNNEKEMIHQAIEGADAILIGPGLSSDKYAKRLLEMVVKADKPLVIDADGLNLLAMDLDCLSFRQAQTIITPHIGEMARLTGLKGNIILENTAQCAETLSKKLNVITILKSAKTVIATNERTYINPFGNPGMATAGSGDVLAGIIISLVGQGLDLELAAVLGVYLHSKAGDMAKGKYGEKGLMARDIVDGILLFQK
jgi:NAD(P)H-hydrate epimerase